MERNVKGTGAREGLAAFTGRITSSDFGRRPTQRIWEEGQRGAEEGRIIVFNYRRVLWPHPGKKNRKRNRFWRRNVC